MRIDWPSYAIMGSGALALGWVFWCTWHNLDPVGWFR